VLTRFIVAEFHSLPWRQPRLYALVSLAVLVGGVSPAHAYIDPGTGAMILQVVIATALGGLYYVIRASKRIRETMTRLFRIGRAKSSGTK